MSTVEQLFSDDVWLLNTDADNLAAVVSKTLASPFVVTTSLEFVIGTTYSGIYLASALSSGVRSFSALVADALGTLYTVTGQLQEDINGVVVASPVFTTLATGSAPFSLAVFVATPNATWYYSTAPDVITPFTAAIGFTAVQGGVITFGTDMTASQSRLARVRMFNGTIPGYPTITETEIALAQDTPSDAVNTLTATIDPVIHAIIGAQLGDLEIDIGKSVPWTSFFASDVYLTDINVGDPRYWIIDWDRTFRTAKYTSLTIDYFTDPAGWREAQFLMADAAWNYHPNDWVLFIDGHEALSCDTRSAPDDVSVSPFASFVHREIQRAIDLGAQWASIPWYAYVRTGVVSAVSYEIEDPDVVTQRLIAAGLDLNVADVNTSVVHVGVPYYYQPTPGGLVRLVKVAALRDPGFDWNMLDQLSAPSANVKVQVVSYGYAHWLNQENGADDGFAIRRMMSRVLPLTGLPLVGSDSAGVQGPYTYSDGTDLLTNPGVGVAQPILTPMYSSVFRDNPRDGIWYLPGDLASNDQRVMPGLAAAVGTAFNKS